MGWFRRRWAMLIPSRAGVARTGDGAAAVVRRVRPGKCGEPAGVACPPRPLLGRLRRRLLHGRVLPVRRITVVTVVAVRAVARMGGPVRDIAALVRIRPIGGPVADAFPRLGLPLGIRHVHPGSCITAVTVVVVRAVAGMVGLVPATAGRVHLGNLIIATMADVVRLVV